MDLFAFAEFRCEIHGVPRLDSDQMGQSNNNDDNDKQQLMEQHQYPCQSSDKSISSCPD